MTLADAREPVVVDMESAALARVAARWGVAFAVVRLISDTPAHPLPAFSAPFASAMAATTTGSRLSLAGRGLFGAIADPARRAPARATGRRVPARARGGMAEARGVVARVIRYVSPSKPSVAVTRSCQVPDCTEDTKGAVRSAYECAGRVQYE